MKVISELLVLLVCLQVAAGLQRPVASGRLLEVARHRRSADLAARDVKKADSKSTSPSVAISKATTSSGSSTTKASVSQGGEPQQAKVGGQKRGAKKRNKVASSRPVDCEYEKGAWGECQSNGIQERVLKLVMSDELSESDGSPKGQPNGAKQTKCEPIKMVRRECRSGCKYMRGEWSSSCQNGLRHRVDLLISPVGQLSRGQTRGGENKTLECQPQRRVTKECKRACHYVKSVWSDCTDGFRTRNLTLDNSLLEGAQLQQQQQQHQTDPNNGNKNKEPQLLLGLGCAKAKQIKRECRPADSEQQRQRKLSVAQKRKLKQIQQRQQQQQSNLGSSTTVNPQPPTLANSPAANIRTKVGGQS